MTVSENTSESFRFEIIKNIFQFTNSASQGMRGVSDFDDAAIVPISEENCLVVASDFVRGSGFTLFKKGYLNYFDVGYYLVAANLSDIAAMGVKPIGLTNIVRYTKDLSNKEFEDILKGIKAACDRYEVIVVGGDIGSYESSVLAATAFGFGKPNQILYRSGAKEGDYLCISGTVGLPFAALMYFDKAKPAGMTLSQSEEELLLKSWQRPIPRIQEALLLSEGLVANSCQDVSDGLKATIEQIGKSSNLTFDVYEEKLPIPAVVHKIANYLGVDPIGMASSASVDFSLLFTVPENKLDTCQELFEVQNLRIAVIGKTNKADIHQLIKLDGSKNILPGFSWDHNAGSVTEQFLKLEK
jgi:thiamine-monophosphate kinase